jgi:hypothetical protein
MTTQNTIRPGVRGRLKMDLSRFKDRTEGIVGNLDDVYPVYHFWVFERLRWELVKVTAEQVGQSPFKPGDRVKDGFDRIGTVILKTDIPWFSSNPATAVHFDEADAISLTHTDSLTLLDYPGKEAAAKGGDHGE